MASALYQEAILEAKQLRKAAEDNATRAVVEAVTPRIRKLIESQILSEDLGDADDDVLLGALGGLEAQDSEEAGITLPDSQGKVTLDLDALTSGDPLAGGVGRALAG